MTYRNTKAPHGSQRWRAWIDEQRSALERIGLPLAVYRDAAHWDDFLANGHLHWHSDGPPFDFSELAPAQMEQLCAVLESEVGGRASPLLGWLRVRLRQVRDQP